MKTQTKIDERMIRITVLLIAKGVPSNQMSFHRKSSSTGGNTKPPRTGNSYLSIFSWP